MKLVKAISFSGLLLALAFFLAGCAMFERPEVAGTSPPVIEDCYASPTATWGETWKIYVKAGDPDGDMAEVRFTIDQPGVLYSDVRGHVFLRRQNWRSVDGYFFLHTPWNAFDVGHIEANVTMMFVDAGGRKSEKVEMPFKLGKTKQVPPPERFIDRAIFALPYNLKTTNDEYGWGR